VKAIILVGGEGTRLRPLTYSTVKAMVPVLNKPFIEHVIRYLNKHNIHDIVLAMGYKPDSIVDYFGNTNKLGAKLVYSVEESPLGTAGAVKNAEKHIDDTFFVLNGDIFTDIDLTDMLKFHRQKKSKLTIALTPVDDPTHFGVVETDADHRITRFVEKPSKKEVTTNRINAGIYILEPEILERIPQAKFCMFEREVFPALLAEGEPAFGYHTDEYWIDTGTPAKYLQLTRDLMYGKSCHIAFQSHCIEVHPRSTIHPGAKLNGPVLIDKDCDIGKGVHLKGPAVIGPGCTLEDGSIIENCILWHNVKVGRGAILRDCIVAGDNHIEDNSRIEGTAINNKAMAKKG